GFGVRVDHDRLEPSIAQRERCLAATVIELDPLPDAVRAAAENHDARLAFFRGAGLVFSPVVNAPGADVRDGRLIRRVVIRRVRLELRRAGIDQLEDGLDAQPLPPAAYLG